jgi:hypothetical protein
MQKTFDKTHHHGNHPKPMVQAGPFHNWLPNFQRLASDSKRAGLRIVNASRHTALKYFEQRSLEDALREDG